MGTQIVKTIEKDVDVQYDENVKGILGHKYILAHILTRTLDEFAEMEPEDVVPLIEGEVFISVVPLDAGETNIIIGPYKKKQSELIVGMNTENKVPGEGEMRFDVLFYVRLKDGLSKMIIDIEAQKEEPKDYGILNRANFYVSRIISSEKLRDFCNDNYDDMVKAYSIWICMNAKECVLSNMHTVQDDALTEHEWKGDPNLSNIILVGVPNSIPEKHEKYELHRFLSTLLSSDAGVTEKLKILKDEYNLIADQKLEERINTMCNLSQGIREEATAKGLISSYLDFNATKEQIITALMKKLSLTCEVAEDYYNKYFEALAIV